MMMQLSANNLPPPAIKGVPWQPNRIGNNLSKLVAVLAINITIQTIIIYGNYELYHVL